VFSAIQPAVFQGPDKAVILSEALRRSIANRGLYGAESKDPGDACWQILLGAFRPQTTPEDKKVTNSERKTRNSILKQNCHLERTRISCHAALDMTACAAFVKESRMKIANATNLNRKSGVA
jgi:hypothetical protein